MQWSSGPRQSIIYTSILGYDVYIKIVCPVKYGILSTCTIVERFKIVLTDAHWFSLGEYSPSHY